MNNFISVSNMPSHFFQILSRAVWMTDPEAPKVPSTYSYSDYDSETLRRAAAKNREVSKKLFSKLRQRQSQRHSGDQEGRPRGVGGSESNEDGLVKRGLAKSPSQVSSTGTNSIYAESSSGSSGIGTLTKQEYAVASPVMLRSSSSDALSCKYFADSVNNVWNTPQQRRNILSMVEVEQEDRTNILAVPWTAQMSSRPVPHPISPEFTAYGPKTSSAAATRGVSRKISSRKKAAKEDFECMRSMPNLCKVPDESLILLPDSETFNQTHAEEESNKSENQSAVSVAKVQRDLNNSSELSTNDFERMSPVYAVPNKQNSNSDTRPSASASVTSIDLLAMKSPPPLPQKPPPPLSNLDDEEQGTFTKSYDRYNSTPCLHYQSSSTNMNNGSEGKKEPASTVMWPTSAHSRLVAPAEPQSALPVSFADNIITNPSLCVPMMSCGGKPTVQVHPMCLNQNGVLSVNVENRDSYSSPQKKSQLSTAPSPRPPVPKKPEYLISPKPKGIIHKLRGTFSLVKGAVRG